MEEEAASKGDQTVASRLGAEFGMTADALIAEKGTYQTGWGELMIAHTLLTSAKTTGVTLDNLFEMRRNGLGWGQIGHGLDLRLGGVVSAVNAESRVAIGAAKADGRPAKSESRRPSERRHESGSRGGAQRCGSRDGRWCRRGRYGEGPIGEVADIQSKGHRASARWPALVLRRRTDSYT